MIFDDAYWGLPQIIDLKEYPDRIEVIYRKEQEIHLDYCKPKKRIYKVIFSCKKGKLIKSNPIHANIVPAQPESYVFEDEKH